MLKEWHDQKICQNKFQFVTENIIIYFEYLSSQINCLLVQYIDAVSCLWSRCEENIS